MNPAIQLISVSKSYRSGTNTIDALASVDLTLQFGELVAVMGPSGSGKSTLLTIAGGLEAPSSGAILVDGVEISSMNAKDLAKVRRKKIGYVFQDFNLIPSLTASENVALALELDGVTRGEAERQAKESLDVVGLSNSYAQYPDALSGGEQQRVAIARSLVGEGKILLADEPTGALDSANGESIMRLIRQECEKGSAAMVVTHDPQLAAWADRVVFIKDGKVIDETSKALSVESLIGDGK